MADLTKSTQHLLEALALGLDYPADSTAPISSGTLTVTIPTAAATAVQSVTATLTGANPGDIILVSGPTVTLAGAGAISASVTAANTVTLSSASTAGFTGASKIYNYILFKQS